MTDTNQLPPLPEPHCDAHEDAGFYYPEMFTGNQMRSYALQARAQVQGEPVYWEWRHLSTHPDTVDFGQWSEWQRVEARNPIFTAEDALAEFRTYIAQGYKYELRALYTTPHPAQATQAEAQQPATGEPVAWAVLTKSGKLHSAHSRRESAESRLDRWRKKRADAGLMYWACRVAPLYTHPAPSADDVVRDAERLNDLEALVKSKGMHGLSFDYCRHVEDGYVVEKGFRLMWRHTLCERKPTLREAIDAAMLAA